MNAKTELLNHLAHNNKTSGDIVAATIYLGHWSLENIQILWSEPSIDTNALDITYDDGYGSQELFGLILYSDGSWSERHEYDGAECWDYKKSPTIEEVLNFKDNHDPYI